MRKVRSSDVVSVLEYFKELKDPRSSINRRHLLGDLIVICILAVIAGADGPKAIGMWAAANQAWLKRRLQLPHGVPSHDTIGRLLALLNPRAFQSCFEAWVSSLGRPDSLPDEEREQIAIDGKALRRSHDHRRGLGPLFLVSAWSATRGISLGQLATSEKSNEITAIPELLANIQLARAIITIDAAGCQRAIAQQIVAAGGDYVLALKGNQATLHEQVQTHFMQAVETDFADLKVRRHQEVVTAHGRHDTLTYYQLPLPESCTVGHRWRGLRTIGLVIRLSETARGETSDVRYYISSLPLGVKRFANLVRNHWSIENTLHWCLDVTFREDENRVRDRIAADNLGWLKRFAISLLKQQPDKESIAMRRRLAGWNVDYLAKVIGLPMT